MLPNVLMNLDFAAGTGAVPPPATASARLDREIPHRRPSYAFGFGYRKAMLWAISLIS